MNTELLFENPKELAATYRVIAAFKVKQINENIDSMVSEVLDYAVKIDEILDENNLEKRYLDKVSTINETNQIEVDSDILDLDFRVREIVEDLVRRINTRINLVKENSLKLLTIEKDYDLTTIDLDSELEISMLAEENYI